MTERLTFNPGDGRNGAPAWRGPRPPGPPAGGPVSGVPSEPPGAPRGRRARSSRPGAGDAAFLFLLAFTALAFFRPQDSIRVLAVLHLAEVSAIGGLIAFAGGQIARGRPITRITPELTGVVALGAIMLIMAPASIWFGGSVGVFKEIYSKVLLMYLLMANVLTSPKRIERLTWLIVIASGYIGARAVLDYGRGVNMIEHGRVEGAIGGMFKNPNDLALNMVSILPLAVFLTLREGSPLRRLTAAGCAFCMLGAVIVSHSRSGALGLAAMAIVFGCFAIRRRPAAVIGTVLLCALAAPLLPSSYWQRLASITNDAEDDTGSKEARTILLHESAQAFLENPLTGVGAGQFKNWNPDGRLQPWRESHDVLLQVGAELGIFGLACFLYLIAAGALAVRRTRQLLRRARLALRQRTGASATAKRLAVPDVTSEELAFFDGHSAAIAAALAGWFVCALFASVAYNWTFYYLLALAATPRDALAARFPKPGPPAAAPVTRWEAAQA